ncbi:B12-binding domain-containing radical SAM protein [Thermodesulfobacteriota bacterium]
MAATANRMAPLGLLSIAAYLARQGHTVFLLDCLGPKAVTGMKANARRILDTSPDIVGFSTTTSGFLDGYDLAARIKTIRPQTTTLFGGVHISSMGAVLLEKYESIDYLCLGEGEKTLGELAAGLKANQIDGLVWRDDGRPVTNPPRTPIQDLDDLPFPLYEKLEGFPKGYSLPLFSYILSHGATMVTSRGCPYQCSYCDRSVFKRGFRSNSAEYIHEHMKHLQTRFGVRHINIYDDLFTLDRRRVEELCSLLISKPLGMQFNCAVRAGHTDDDLLQLLKDAGFLQLSLGIETGDPDLLKFHKQGMDLDDITDTVNCIKTKGLRVKGLFMMGLPGDTEESIRKTSDFVISLGLDDMNMSKFTPFHGAPIWSTISEFGTMDEDWRKMNCLNFVFVPKGIESKERLDQLYNQHVKRFYTDPGWRRRFRKRLLQHRKSLWYMLIHLPAFLSAKRSFKPRK